MSKKKKLKIVLTENVTRKMEKLSAKEQKKLMKAFEKVAENPYTGKPVKGVEIKAWDNEKCDCGKPFHMWLELDDDEVYFSCKEGKCGQSFWCTKQELIKGRKNYVKKANSAGKEIAYIEIEVIE